MKIPSRFTPRINLRALAGLLLLEWFSSIANAQTAAPSAKPANTAPGETIQLNAFEVRSEADNSYGALDSNSLAAFRMELFKAPATAEVFTRTFMDDLAIDSLEDVLTGYSGTVTAASNNAAAGLDAVIAMDRKASASAA